MGIKKYLQTSLTQSKLLIKSKGSSKSWTKAILGEYPFLPFFEVKGLSQVALDIIRELHPDRKVELIDSTLGATIVERIMNNLVETKKINKFAPNGMVTFETAKEIYLMYIRLASEGHSVIYDEKFQELDLIFNKIEDEIKQINTKGQTLFITEVAALTNSGMEVEKNNSVKKDDIIIASDNKFSKLELAFLEKLSQHKRVYILQININYDAEELLQALKNHNIEITDNLILQDINSVSTHAYIGYGRRNEVRGVIQYIADNQLTFDECEILYINKKYNEEILRQCDLNEIKVVSDSGKTIYQSNSFVFVKELLQYMTNDFDINLLNNSLTSIPLNQKTLNEIIDFSLLSIDDKMVDMLKNIYVFGSEWREFIIELHADYGFKRIKDIIQYHKKEDTFEAEKMNSEIKKLVPEDTFTGYSKLKDIKYFLLLASIWKQFEKNIDGSQRLQGMQEILKIAKKFIRVVDVNNKEEAKARLAIVEHLDLLVGLVHSKIDELKLSNIIDSIEAISAIDEQSQEGAILINPLRNKAMLQRKHTFIIGLDSLSYPVETLESPIISDGNLQAIDQNLETSQQQSLRTRQEIERLLTTGKSTICFSYSNYDIANCRNQNPSSLWLKYGNENAETVTFISMDDSTISTPIEHLLYYQKELLKDYENSNKQVTDNTKAEIKLDTNNNPLYISATRLDIAAECGYRYYLKYVLHLEPQKEITSFDKWLAPYEKGLIIHNIFKIFVEKIIDGKLDIKDKIQSKQVLVDIINQEFDTMSKLNPPKNVNNYIYEVQLAKDNILKYLDKLVHEYDGLWMPYKAEYEIDYEMKIDKYLVHVKGSIDRMDIREEYTTGKTAYRIIDYKTGSSNYFHLENKMQNALYYLAVNKLSNEKILKENLEFNSAQYEMIYDPSATQKAQEGQDEIDDKLNRIVSIIQDIYSRKYMQVDIESNKSCKYCDYKVICRRREVG